MFASQNNAKEESKFELDTNNTEDDYFEIMKNMNNENKVCLNNILDRKGL